MDYKTSTQLNAAIIDRLTKRLDDLLRLPHGTLSYHLQRIKDRDADQHRNNRQYYRLVLIEDEDNTGRQCITARLSYYPATYLQGTITDNPNEVALAVGYDAIDTHEEAPQYMRHRASYLDSPDTRRALALAIADMEVVRLKPEPR